MKKILTSFGWLLLLLPFISVAGTQTIFSSLSHAASLEERQVANFTGISSSGPYDVHVTMGSTESLRIEGDADDLEAIVTKVENGILRIYKKTGTNHSNWGFNNRIKVYITARILNSLSQSGSGDIQINGVLKPSNLNIKVSGSGSVKASIQANKINASISGSGEIDLNGIANEANVAISGSGEFEGRNLKSDKANVKVSGSGEAYIFAASELNASLSGSGQINYTGNPEIHQTKSGSGKISKL
jgi:hypothetical protein